MYKPINFFCLFASCKCSVLHKGRVRRASDVWMRLGCIYITSQLYNRLASHITQLQAHIHSGFWLCTKCSVFLVKIRIECTIFRLAGGAGGVIIKST